MRINRVGVDLAKNVFQVHGVDRHGKRMWKRQLRRSNWLQALLEKTDVDCEIGMEACSGAHHWARELQGRGYRVKLIPPQYVKPYVKSQKNDATDAEAICEAMSRPGMRFVAVKTVEQQDIQAVHRVRSSLIGHGSLARKALCSSETIKGGVVSKSTKPNSPKDGDEKSREASHIKEGIEK